MPDDSSAPFEHFDVIIVGAGLSGIDAAHHLREKCPHKTFVILESRGAIGGTWDVFRYPGVRSDSDMFTMSYPFRPWQRPQSISDGESIRRYICDTAREDGTDSRIRFDHRVVCAEWSSSDTRWTVQAVRKSAGCDGGVTLTCNFLFSCAGYYRYAAGHMPEFCGRERFRGRLVHPQAWPDDLDWSGKRVVVIGSGATAVTLVPAMAKRAAHVTMLQRSPTYVVSYPMRDSVAIELSRILPSTLAYRIARWKNIALMTSTYRFALRWPELAKKTIAKHVRRQLGDACEVDPHFTPRYAPWRQRLCVAPDGDLFATIREGRARVVTDEIETFTEHGIRLRSGEDLEADVVVAATGIDLEVLGGIDVRVDAAPVDFSKTLYYKGVMFSGVPNLASVFGYIGASWTLKADLICSYVARLIAYMDRNRYVQVVPRDDGAGEMSVAPFVEGFTPGYVRRSLAKLPKQRASAPWRVHQNYFADVLTLKYAPIRNRALRFARSPKRPSIDPSVLAADNR